MKNQKSYERFVNSVASRLLAVTREAGRLAEASHFSASISTIVPPQQYFEDRPESDKQVACIAATLFSAANALRDAAETLTQAAALYSQNLSDPITLSKSFDKQDDYNEVVRQLSHQLGGEYVNRLAEDLDAASEGYHKALQDVLQSKIAEHDAKWSNDQANPVEQNAEPTPVGPEPSVN